MLVKGGFGHPSLLTSHNEYVNLWEIICTLQLNSAASAKEEERDEKGRTMDTAYSS